MALWSDSVSAKTDNAKTFGGARAVDLGWLGKVAARILPGILFCVLLAAAWQLMAVRLASPLIPDLQAVTDEFGGIVASGEAWRQIGTTLGRLTLGLFFGFSAALAIGLASARNRFAKSFFEPALLLGLTVPGLVWALLCVIWFGLSLKTSVVAIALGIAPALAVNIAQGIESVDPQLVEAAHVYRLKFRVRLRSLWLPAILPFLMGGLRLAFSLAWKVVVLVEVFGLSSGVGYALNTAFISQNVAAVLAWTLAFTFVVATIEYGLFQTVERRLTRWKRKASV